STLGRDEKARSPPPCLRRPEPVGDASLPAPRRQPAPAAARSVSWPRPPPCDEVPVAERTPTVVNANPQRHPVKEIAVHRVARYSVGSSRHRSLSEPERT